MSREFRQLNNYFLLEKQKRPRRLDLLGRFDIDWLRGLDLNQRPLGYERPKISVSIGQQGTSGNPEIPLGTAGTAYWGPYGD